MILPTLEGAALDGADHVLKPSCAHLLGSNRAELIPEQPWLEGFGPDPYIRAARSYAGLPSSVEFFLRSVLRIAAFVPLINSAYYRVNVHKIVVWLTG